jgi:hypothetical protein
MLAGGLGGKSPSLLRPGNFAWGLARKLLPFKRAAALLSFESSLCCISSRIPRCIFLLSLFSSPPLFSSPRGGISSRIPRCTFFMSLFASPRGGISSRIPRCIFLLSLFSSPLEEAFLPASRDASSLCLSLHLPEEAFLPASRDAFLRLRWGRQASTGDVFISASLGGPTLFAPASWQASYKEDRLMKIWAGWVG